MSWRHRGLKWRSVSVPTGQRSTCDPVPPWGWLEPPDPVTPLTLRVYYAYITQPQSSGIKIADPTTQSKLKLKLNWSNILLQTVTRGSYKRDHEIFFYMWLRLMENKHHPGPLFSYVHIKV